MSLIRFNERQAFGHYKAHYVNPEDVSVVHQAGGYGEESVIVLKSGERVLVDAKAAEVVKILNGDG